MWHVVFPLASLVGGHAVTFRDVSYAYFVQLVVEPTAMYSSARCSGPFYAARPMKTTA